MNGEPREGDVIVVWFSNGAASAIAWQETLRRYGNLCDVRAVNNPVAEEDPDNLRFGAAVAMTRRSSALFRASPISAPAPSSERIRPMSDQATEPASDAEVEARERAEAERDQRRKEAGQSHDEANRYVNEMIDLKARLLTAETAFAKLKEGLQRIAEIGVTMRSGPDLEDIEVVHPSVGIALALLSDLDAGNGEAGR